MNRDVHRKITRHPVEVLLGVRALPGAAERSSAAPERAIFAAERASELKLPPVLLPNVAVGFSYYYPPLRGQPSLGKMGAFRDSDNKQMISWVVDMLRLLERPDWDGGRSLTGWSGGIITMMATPQPDAPNLMQLVVNWPSGIDGRKCAEFCERLEEAYITRGGYYDHVSIRDQRTPVSASPVVNGASRYWTGKLLTFLGLLVMIPFAFGAFILAWDHLADFVVVEKPLIFYSMAFTLDSFCGHYCLVSDNATNSNYVLIPLSIWFAAPGVLLYMIGHRLLNSDRSV